MKASKFALIFLILANLLPVIGVMYWGWSLSVLITVYWLENLIIGIFNIPKIALSIGTVREKIGTTAFFIFHYGLFWLGHGLFLLVALMPAIRKNPIVGVREVDSVFNVSVRLTLLSLFASHLISFLFNFMRHHKDNEAYATAQMFAPYGRVFLLHILILVGAYLAGEFGSSIWVLVLFVVMKLIIDIIAHLVSNSMQTNVPRRR